MKARTAELQGLEDQAWRSDKRWRGGKIADSSMTSTTMMLLFALVWNAIGWPVFVLSWNDRNIGNFRYLIALFPITGVLLALAAAVSLFRRLKFGTSTFELETMPGKIGGYLAGTIQASPSLQAAESVRLRLHCVNRVVSGSGKNRSTDERVKWEDEQTLVGRLPAGGGRAAIPVSFAIPAGAQPTRDDVRDEIIWRLEVSAAMDGADYQASFNVPVFQTSDARVVPKTEAVAAKLRRPAPPTTQRASEAGIRYNKDTAGRVTFHFPPARNKHGAALLTVMAAIFLGVAIGMRVVEAGGMTWIFTIVFGLFGAGMLIGAAYMWFMSRTLYIRQETIEIAWRMLTLHGRRTVARSEIFAVRHKINSQAGNTPYLQVILDCRDDSVTVAGGLRMNDAKWIAGEIGQTLNVPVRGD